MPLVLYESKDFGQTINPIWSGISFIPQNVQIYADIFDTYIMGLHSFMLAPRYLTRIDTSPEGAYEETDLELGTTSSPLEMTHYLGEFGVAQYSVIAETIGGTKYLKATTYPEVPGSWVAYYPEIPEPAVDIVAPDMPESPRFVIGFDGNTTEKVYVVLSQDVYLSTRYATNWTAMASGASVKDLEVVRFI